MKYAAVAVALVGAAIADSALDVQWENWSTTTKVEDPKTWSTWDPKDPHGPHPPKKTDTETWSSWDPKDPHGPKKTSTEWNTWTAPEKTTTAKCSYVTEIATSKCIPGHPDQCWPYKKTSTVYPEKCTESGWENWNTVPDKTTTAKCSYVTEYPVTKCAPHDDKKCWVKHQTKTVYPDNCDEKEWNTWVPEVPDKTTTAECSYITDYPVTKCLPAKKDEDKTCFVKHFPKTVYPDNCDNKEWNTWVVPEIPDKATTKTEWGVWETTITVPYDYVITNTWADWESATKTPVVVTSVVKPGWEKDGWFGPEWPEAKDGQCATNVVTSYGYPIWVPAPEPTTVVKVVESTWAQWSEKPKEVVETTTWATWAPEKPKETTVKVETTWATWTDAAKPTPEGPKPGKPGKPGKAEHAPNGNKWAVTYGPYDEAGKCKTVEVIKADVKKIKDLGFTTIRVYSTDCKTLEYVGDACREHGLKIIIGVFIAKSGIEGAKPQVKDIVAWAQWDIVELVVIGNEAVFQGFCKPDELVLFIKYCKEQFVSSGYTGPCTTTEPLGEWEKDHDKYCGVVDVVSANLYAYFNNECTADKAGEFIQSQITILNGLCKGKETYVMECGWPSEGQCNGKACAGKKEQAVAIKGIQDTCGAKIVFFNYEDEHWKQPGQYGVEQHWGVYDVFSGKGDSWSSWGKW